MLACPHGDARRVPSRLKIFGEPREIRYAGRFSRSALSQTCLKLLDTAKSNLPGAFELGGDQAIVGVAGGVATLRERGVVAGLAQLQLHDAPMFVDTFHMHPLGFLGRFDRYGLYCAQQLADDSRLDTGAAESEAARQTQHKVGPIATIDRSAGLASDIADRQPSAAAPTGEEAGQKRPAAAAGFWTPLASVGVGGEQRLVALELGPGNITFVMILDHHLPVLKRLGMLVSLACSSIDDLGLLAALTVDVGAGVKWVLEH